MATRSTIAYEDVNGIVTKIYCHWDGYLENNGKILQEHYQDIEKIDQLMRLGDLSILDREVGEKQDFNNRNRDAGWCLAYGRDRGETDCEPKVYNDFQEYLDQSQMEEYNYIFRNGTWFVSAYGNEFRALDEALKMEC